ncbi:MAG: catalase [Clostridiales bacterium]|nr:catalase [Clostridiales bacterium]
MRKAWLHFKTITKHRHKVIQHCFKAGIPLQGLLHDLSKYSPAEFFVGAKFYQGNRSPNEGERETYGFSSAWMHHKGRNKHHYEYWTDYSPVTRVISPVKMPFNYVVEMFCDRVAASKIYLKDKYNDRSPLEYFLKSKDRRIIHPETSREIEDLLTMLAERGEEYTFAYIRNLVKSGKEKKMQSSKT